MSNLGPFYGILATVCVICFLLILVYSIVKSGYDRTSKVPPTYVIHAGEVLTLDGHYVKISHQQIADSYGLKASDWIAYTNNDQARKRFEQYPHEYIHLFPLKDNQYKNLIALLNHNYYFPEKPLPIPEVEQLVLHNS